MNELQVSEATAKRYIRDIKQDHDVKVVTYRLFLKWLGLN